MIVYKPSTARSATVEHLSLKSKLFHIEANGCWNWIGSLKPGRNNYGRLFHDGRSQNAHKWFYELIHGPVGNNDLDHLCRNPRCVNPAHLEPVTHKENVYRSEGKAAINARKKLCIRGHKFTTRVYAGKTRRQCRICSDAASLAHYYGISIEKQLLKQS